MGCGQSSESKHTEDILFIPDKHKTIDAVIDEFREKGFDAANLLFAIDLTTSNRKNGRKTFQGKSLHHLEKGKQNPYQECIEIVGRTLQEFDDDDLIPAWFFGGQISGKNGLTAFKANGEQCHGFEEVLKLYEELVPQIELASGSTFHHIINEAINQVIESDYEYHVLIIVADGQIPNGYKRVTDEAIVRASHYPMSIIMIGVGDGPWEQMEHYDDDLEGRMFDNFQFVDFYQEMHRHHFETDDQKDAHFALRALMEVPTQYGIAAKLGLGSSRKASGQKVAVNIYDPPASSSSSSFSASS